MSQQDSALPIHRRLTDLVRSFVTNLRAELKAIALEGEDDEVFDRIVAIVAAAGATALIAARVRNRDKVIAALLHAAFRYFTFRPWGTQHG